MKWLYDIKSHILHDIRDSTTQLSQTLPEFCEHAQLNTASQPQQ